MGEKTDIQTLKGKVAIVTGASRGLGYGLALELARRGAKIVATYTSASSESKVKELAGQIAKLDPPIRCITVRGDLADASTPASIVRQAVDALGPQIDIVVNNAGVEVVKSLDDMKPEDFDSVYAVNVRAPLLLAQAVKPHLPSRGGGRIINISSVGARLALANLSIYSSSKAALEGLTRCLAAEMGAHGHTVNAVNPGPVKSEMMDRMPQDLVDTMKKATLMQARAGEADDVAQVVAWLASEESRWITGQAISASGGFSVY
ncbi:3-oxoacyl-[acyl-carrier protein] reductase [Geosmithia morbida]|uniref:3-oxoacyl-[acyl-carrier protein] reductase n=1 Tax=Geosmithia morbida TaxID=1094350 RepID=A0A9P5D7I5_9HYPO|nr:3-oxoacyl-[acyl-carrier protein] reductase [Geosmithia morbida]KAF4125825.1 3-oxoacyl-[acyl-carrier protein] reductase [Geosmithia morbida]